MVLRGTEPRLAKRHSPSLQFFLICKEREGALSKKSPLLIKEYFFSRDEEGGKNAGLHPRARTVHMAESLRCQPKEIHQRETRRKRWRLSGRKRGKHRVVSQGRRLALENWSPSTKAIGHFFPPRSRARVYQLINLSRYAPEFRRCLERAERKQHHSRAKVNQVCLIVLWCTSSQPGKPHGWDTHKPPD